MRAIIIDDEQSARMTLRSILGEFFKDVEVIDEADNPTEGRRLVEKWKPDVVFLDIQMDGGTGFDMLDDLGEYTFQLIFISAHRQHAFDSYRFEAVEYLLKPVRIKDLRACLVRVREKLAVLPPTAPPAILRAISSDQSKMQLIIPETEGFTVVKLSEIVRIESSRSYSDFYLVGDRKVTACKAISEFDDLLANHSFHRIHKSHIINLYHLASFQKGKGGEATMVDGTVLPVSRLLKDTLIELFLH